MALKKFLATLSLGTILTAGTFTNVFAFEIDNSKLTTDQQKVLEDYINSKETVQDNRARASYRASFKRGSALMWSRDNIDFSTSSGKVTSSSFWQEKGFVFPNIVRVHGGTRYYTSSSLHKWRATKTMGAGVVTPWGDVNVYEKDVTDYYGVDKNAKSYWY